MEIGKMISITETITKKQLYDLIIEHIKQKARSIINVDIVEDNTTITGYQNVDHDNGETIASLMELPDYIQVEIVEKEKLHPVDSPKHEFRSLGVEVLSPSRRKPKRK